jgi:hypothetical protein
LTATEPVSPAHSVFIGWVAISNANNGRVILHIQNGYELDELHDVLITTPTDGQVLAYEASTSLWKNVTPSGGGGVEVLGSDFTDIDATDTTANALSVTIPSGKLGANGDSLSISATMSVTGTTGSFTIAPTFGANAMGTISLSANGTYLTNVDIVRTSSTSFRASLGGVSVATNAYTSVTGLSAGWFDSNRTFEFDISTNNADRTITFRFGRVEFLPAP